MKRENTKGSENTHLITEKNHKIPALCNFKYTTRACVQIIIKYYIFIEEEREKGIKRENTVVALHRYHGCEGRVTRRWNLTLDANARVLSRIAEALRCWG